MEVIDEDVQNVELKEDPFSHENEIIEIRNKEDPTYKAVGKNNEEGINILIDTTNRKDVA